MLFYTRNKYFFYIKKVGKNRILLFLCIFLSMNHKQENMKRKYAEHNSIVIDLTYRCNAKCKYCQWGDNATPGRVDLPDEYIYIPRETLETLETKRIVFSGGEPVLRKNLHEIIAYYQNLKIEEIIIISNGLLLDESRLDKLIAHGLTGVTFSLDGIDYASLGYLRGYSVLQVDKILKNFHDAVGREIEIGVNCVLSKGNIYGDNILNLVRFVNSSKVDFLKFNPIFDDGYVGKNAPSLILNKDDSPQILRLREIVVSNICVYTNDYSFWDILAKQLEGVELDGKHCGLTHSQQIAIRDKLKFCFWIDEPHYGKIQNPVSPLAKTKIQEDFTIKKAQCKTGMYCHCLQKMSHQWKIK